MESESKTGKTRIDPRLDAAGWSLAPFGTMHAYKDAIPEARWAWVMFPGTTPRYWVPDDATEDHAARRAMVGRMLGAEAVPASPEAA